MADRVTIGMCAGCKCYDSKHSLCNHPKMQPEEKTSDIHIDGWYDAPITVSKNFGCVNFRPKE